MNERPSVDPEAEVQSQVCITSIPLNASLPKNKTEKERRMKKMKEL